ncbi:MAG: metallophosphoesterase [Candidatus Obscuribacterales bacterium]|nr:metallophosphoesterase [Steroidobacteraceae bacterium]
MRALLQISDAHFGTEQAPVVEALLQLSRSVQPDVVVLSGDITQRARKSQFAAARAFSDQLNAAHLLAIPGNHDIPLFDVFSRVFRPYGNFSREFGRNLEPEVDIESALILCLNTSRAKRHKDGEVSRDQIERVRQRLLRASARQVRIVVTHQPVHVIDDHDIPNLLYGREDAVRAWSQAGADIIMGGHIHLPHVRPLSDRFTNLPRRVWSVQAGTAVSHRVRDNAPNSVNIVRPHPSKCVVERWDYDAVSSAFRLQEQHALELDR